LGTITPIGGELTGCVVGPAGLIRFNADYVDTSPSTGILAIRLVCSAAAPRAAVAPRVDPTTGY
jgi:hypothetical protein